MNAIGNCANRILREHTGRDLAMTHGDSVDEARESQREKSHVQQVIAKALSRIEKRDWSSAENREREWTWKFVMARRYWRVGREYAALANRFDFLFTGRSAASDPIEEAYGEKRRVPFIHVITADICVTERVQQLRTAKAKHSLLHQAVALIAAVK